MRLKYLASPLLLCSLTVLTACSGGGGGGPIGSALNKSDQSDSAVSSPAPGNGDANGGTAVSGSDDPAPGGRPAPGSETESATAAAEADAEADSPESLPELTFNGSDAPTFQVPATAVDCESSLPCRWISDGGGFAVTITQADNTASLDRLLVHYRVDVLHDTSVLLGSSKAARDPAGRRIQPIRQSLEQSNGASPIALLAGDTATGSVTFDQGVSDPTLLYLNIALSDNGVPASAGFTALPIGSASSEPADCKSTLPCTWTSASGDVRVSLVAAGGYDANNRLAVSFLVESDDDEQVVLDAGSLAIGNDGLPIEALNHRLGNQLSIEPVTHRVFGGIALAGEVNFYRTANRPASLAQLELSFYRDSPEPRWDPRFRGVPLQ